MKTFPNPRPTRSHPPPHEQPDWLLVQALRRQDPDALEAIIRRYYDLTYRLAMNVHGADKAKALTAVRQLFLHVWENAPTIPRGYESPGVSFQHYILNSFAQTPLSKTIWTSNIPAN